MPDPNERDAKLIQYLNEAYGKEKELEVSLQAHILMTTKAPYKKRLQQHLKETKGHAKGLERRIKKLGGNSSAAQSLVGQATAAAKGPLHMLRGDGEQEKMLKNAKTEYFNEHEEIANYVAIENLATKVSDSDTAKLAREIRRDEERMAKFLEGQIKQLAAAVAVDEVPADQRRSGSKLKTKKAGGKKSTAKKSAGKKAARKSATKSSAKKSGATKKAGSKKSASKSRTTKKSAAGGGATKGAASKG